MSMDKSRNILSLQLEWIRTADSKVPPIFAINLAMLAVTVALIKTLQTWTISQAVITALCLIPLLLSIGFLALSMFPRLTGPKGSNIYFGGITKKQESTFIDEVLNINDEDHDKDILSQAYRNAEIAEEKYRNIKNAFISTFISTPFWLISIYFLYIQ